MINLEKIGQFICDMRKKKNLTQSELGNLTFVSPQAVSKWENGLSAPDITTIPHLVKALDVTVDMLINGSAITSEENPITKEFVEASINKEYRYIATNIEKDPSSIDSLIDLQSIINNDSIEKVIEYI